MKSHVPLRFFAAHSPEALLKIIEVAPGVTVVGTEAGEVYVRQKEDIVGNSEAAMAAGMPWKVNALDRQTAEVKDVAITEAAGVGRGA